jgi:LmbE family N-acetylglucosaminyl deacetylase
MWPSIVIVAAHPDDEVIGLGGQLSQLRDSLVIHVTDGALRADADRESRAALRRDELLSALRIAGIPEERALALRVADQEASHHMASLARRLRDLWLESVPDIVFTHPYEGGHPDHDAAAFAVHAACRLLYGDGVRPPEIWEFTSYHAGPQGMAVGEFLPPDGGVNVITLHADARARKRSMLACFESQRDMLRNFPVECEKLRPAPEYEFTVPPHEGTLFYENYDWGMTGERWRALAAEALRDLRVGPLV